MDYYSILIDRLSYQSIDKTSRVKNGVLFNISVFE